jgi:hypothetical protein
LEVRRMKNLREEMPHTAAWVDSVREAFGADMVNGQIKKAMRGEPTFYARENGHEIGTRDMRATAAIHTGRDGNSHCVEPPWMIEARQLTGSKEIAGRTNYEIPVELESEANALRVIMINWEGSDG